MNLDFGKWLGRGGLVALAMTTVMTAGCGGGGGGSSASSGDGSSANTPPTISASPATQASVGSAYALAPQANDADGDTLAFSIQNKPTWANFNTATGQLTGTPNEQSSTSDIVITVSDGKASAALPAFSIVVGVPDASAPGSSVSAGPGIALSWNVPTRTVEGDNLQDLAGYRIHYGTNKNALVGSIEIKSSGANTFKVQNLPRGTYYFAVRAVAANGAESKLSNVISRVVS